LISAREVAQCLRARSPGVRFGLPMALAQDAPRKTARTGAQVHQEGWALSGVPGAGALRESLSRTVGTGDSRDFHNNGLATREEAGRGRGPRAGTPSRGRALSNELLSSPVGSRRGREPRGRDGAGRARSRVQ